MQFSDLLKQRKEMLIKHKVEKEPIIYEEEVQYKPSGILHMTT